MTRWRLYNPAQLTRDELKASFAAREDTLATMLRLTSEQPQGRPCQHMMLIGPRGMGKTTLGLRFLHEVSDTPDLAERWQPVAFYEESYDIGDLSDFWLAALQHLTRATEEPQWADRAASLARDERNPERLAAYALSALLDFCQAREKRLLLFVENLDVVFKQMDDEQKIHALRASLIEHPEILLLGSANTVFEAIRGHGEPLYEFFQLFILRGLGREETLRILEILTRSEGKPGIAATLDHEYGRLETIRQLTGGNPRLLVLACRMLLESPLGPAFEDLERLIDEQTPYFKARIEELPVQARKVFHGLAEGWRPMLAREVADAAKLSSSHASAQLRQLIEKGYAREVHLADAKRTRYEVSDRFYNIYYLLRFSRAERIRLERLVAFLHELFGPTSMRTMYPAALETLRSRGSRAGETSDWLSVLASYVAGDEDFQGRDDWLRQALDLANSMIGPDARVIGEIRKAFANQKPADTDRFFELIKRGKMLLESERFADAEEVYRKAIKERAKDSIAWTMLGLALMQQERFEDALAAFERGKDYGSPDGTFVLNDKTLGAAVGACYTLFLLGKYSDTVVAVQHFLVAENSDNQKEVRNWAPRLWTLSGQAHSKLEQQEEAIGAWERVVEYVQADGPPDGRQVGAEALSAKGTALSKLERHEEAIVAWGQVVEYVQADDPPGLRHVGAEALTAKGTALNELKRHEEAVSAWKRAVEHVQVDDPLRERHTAVIALLNTSATLLGLGRLEELHALWLTACDYVHLDDPTEERETASGLFTTVSKFLNSQGRAAEAEVLCKRVVTMEPLHEESWRVLAEAILLQDDPGRLPEAEDCARRAVEWAPQNARAFHTLSDILAHRGNWTEALRVLEHAFGIVGNKFKGEEWIGLTDSLVRIVGAGHGLWVKRMMKQVGMVEAMEPLWHAVRAELGEELEPLPAEIMDTVTEIRNRFGMQDAFQTLPS